MYNVFYTFFNHRTSDGTSSFTNITIFPEAVAPSESHTQTSSPTAKREKTREANSTEDEIEL
jgi:hypothetical protein